MKRWQWLVAAALAIGCLALLLSQVSMDQFKAAFRQVRPIYAVAGFGVVLLSYLMEAVRYRLFFRGSISFRTIFGVTLAQNLIAQLIPARAGDVGYILMIKKTGIASVGYGVASLMVCRLMDLAMLTAMYLWSLSMLDLQMPAFRVVAHVLGAGVTGTLLFAGMLVIFRRQVAGSAKRFLEWTRLIKLQLVKYLWDEMATALPNIAKLKLVRHVLPMMVFSALHWAATALWLWLIWRAVNVTFTAPQLLFIFTFTNILGVFPLFFFGGIGTGDAANALVLKAFGVETTKAVSVALCNRVLGICYQIALVFVALMLLHGSLKQATADQRANGKSDAHS